MRHQSPVALVVSADRQIRQLIVASLDELGCTTLDAASDQQGLEFAAITRVDCVIIDACPPETLVSNMIRSCGCYSPKSGALSGRSGGRCSRGPLVRLAAHDTCLNKPFELSALCRIVESWCDRELAFVNVAGMSMN